MKTMRDDKERIVWQNQSHLVLEFLKERNEPVKLLDLVLVTDALATWIMQGKSSENINKIKEIDKYFAEKK